jgi:hypothetical protein
VRAADVCGGCRELLAADVQAHVDEAFAPPPGGWPDTTARAYFTGQPEFRPVPVRLAVTHRECCARCGTDHDVYGYETDQEDRAHA